MRIIPAVLAIAVSATVASATLLPRGGSPAPPRAPAAAQNQSVGVTVISDDEKIGVMAEGLSGQVGESAARIATRLRQVRARGGPALYIQMQHAPGPFTIEVTPDNRSAVFMPLRGQMMMGQIPQGTNARQSVVMFWVLRGSDDRFRVSVPSGYRHVAIVVNGREIVNQPLDAAAGRRTYTVR